MSVLILRVYFRRQRTTWLALGGYITLLLVTTLVNEAGKMLAFAPLRVTAYRLMTLLNSPMLLALLFCAFYFRSQFRQPTCLPNLPS
ncbi:hypothetical protein [Hymenobacter sp. BT188]|uniref:hypothetical protein n=1 Tax=Hymenobacter sp. BT188 TaxID=2763504 RepID=UPI0016516E6A|nr:hypothetical protein [Hymenobacter sp. BT188]